MSESTDPQVQRIRDAVRVAEGIQEIDGRDLLASADTNPAPAVSGLRERLATRRQRASLRYRHRAAHRAERADDFDQAMDERGHRELRKRQLATSPARKAANLARIQTAVILVAVPVIIALGAASTTAVHAFMVKYASASAAVAWGVEPAVIALVSGVIVVRALMLRNGAVLPPLVTWIERLALGTSVLMCLLGSGWGAIVAPLGVALVAITVERIIAGIADADVGDLPEVAPTRKGTHVVGTPQRPSARRWERLGDGRRRRVGGPRFEGWVPPPDNPLVLPIVATDDGGDQGVTDGPDDDPEPAWVGEIEAFANRPEPPDSGIGARTEGPSDTPTGDATGAASVTGGDKGTDLPTNVSDDGGEATERVVSAAEAKRIEGEENRRRISDYLVRHPGASATEIAEAVGLTERTVKRHRKTLRGEG
ncbi:winged helix-turn-helix domain-containing protein [Nocardiopsis sp. NRRL B-16309]|uniref:winged helix-turn-helix domain-containing protein n=1 Tax=Nocardiopsis sp. NRRL B-16309 TaxID=1519494 RepID=UPI0006AE9A85|nr:winged helix-turn-helix domain-containing protein [Nocardiopsis sp. NRRL B-16309]KOX10230.1 hypothetical protein ADL05_26580 [Nocardiopsis sp. NRRL B-16309]